MRITKDIAPGLLAGLTNANELVIMLDTEDGEYLAKVTDIDYLAATLRHLELIQAEDSAQPGTMTTAEVDLNRRAAQ